MCECKSVTPYPSECPEFSDNYLKTHVMQLQLFETEHHISFSTRYADHKPLIKKKKIA